MVKSEDVEKIARFDNCDLCQALEQQHEVHFTSYGRHSTLEVGPHDALEQQALRSVGSDGGLWLFRCRECGTWWHIVHWESQNQTWVYPVGVTSVEDWMHQTRDAPRRYGTRFPPWMIYVYLTAGTVAGLLASLLWHRR